MSKSIPKPDVRVVALDKLRPWKRNPREGHAVDAIKRSIEEIGYQAPIIVQKGTMRIVAGHGRYKALRRMGVKKVPVIVADIDDRQADLYTIADNRITELAGWDLRSLAKIVKEIEADGGDTSMTGFDAAELRKLSEWEPPEDNEDIDEEAHGEAKKTECPKCGHRF